jgi:hypothetical protein
MPVGGVDPETEDFVRCVGGVVVDYSFPAWSPLARCRGCLMVPSAQPRFEALPESVHGVSQNGHIAGSGGAESESAGPDLRPLTVAALSCLSKKARIEMKITKVLVIGIAALALTAPTTAAVVAALSLVRPPSAAADMCHEGAVNRAAAGDYSVCQGGGWQHYPAPTFDPNSGDGYGPNQPFPPACIRFNQPCPQ